MYCSNCGHEIGEDAVFCTHCGVPTNNMVKNYPLVALEEDAQENKVEEKKLNPFGLAGFIVNLVSIYVFFGFIASYASVFVGIVCSLPAFAGFALSLVGFVKKHKYSLKGITIAGFVIGIVMSCIWGLYLSISLGELSTYGLTYM